MGDTKLFDPSEDLLKLTDFFAKREPGDKVSWDEIQDATGVVMDDAGKDKARRATVRAGHPEPEPMPGVGLYLACPENCLAATARRLRKGWRELVRMVRHADACRRELELDKTTGDHLLHQSANIAGLALAAKQKARETQRLQATTQEQAAKQASEADRIRTAQEAALKQVKRSSRKGNDGEQKSATA
jgi:hypothetical protein